MIELRNERGIEQSRTLELLAIKLNWHGKTSMSMYMRNKFLHTLSYDTVTTIFENIFFFNEKLQKKILFSGKRTS